MTEEEFFTYKPLVQTEGTILIKYEDGEILLGMDQMFGCNRKHKSRLFKLIKDNCTDKQIDYIIEYCQNRIDHPIVKKYKENEYMQRSIDELIKIRQSRKPKSKKLF